jgi:hypothetical protein
MKTQVFNPVSQTHVIQAQSTALAGVKIELPEERSALKAGVYRIINNNAEAVTLGWSTRSAADAQTKANTTAAVGTPQSNFMIAANSIEYVRLPSEAFLSAKADSSVELYVVLGEGI